MTRAFLGEHHDTIMKQINKEIMKRVIFILITSLYFSNAYATFIKSDSTKKDSTKKHLNLIVKGDILLPIFELFLSSRQNDFLNFYCSFAVEKLLKKRHSMQITYLGSWGHYYEGWIHNFLQIIPEYKFFVSKKKSHSGYYVGAFGLFEHS